MKPSIFLKNNFKDFQYYLEEGQKKEFINEIKMNLLLCSQMYYEITQAYSLGTRIDEKDQEFKHPEADVFSEEEIHEIRMKLLSNPTGRKAVDMIHFLSVSIANSIFFIEEKLNTIAAIEKGMFQGTLTFKQLKKAPDDKIRSYTEANGDQFIQALNFHVKDIKIRKKAIQEVIKKQRLTSIALDREFQMMEARIKEVIKINKPWQPEINSYRFIKVNTREVERAKNSIFEFLNLNDHNLNSKLI